MYTNVTDTHNILLVASAGSPFENDTCMNLLMPEPAQDIAVLSITLVETPDQRVSVWHEKMGKVAPARAGIIAVGDGRRSGLENAEPSTALNDCASAVTVTSLSSASDLSALGLAIDDHLAGWANEGCPIVVCFHSVSALLQHHDLEQVFRFLHLVTGRVAAADGLAHYHLDGEAHDSQPIRTLSSLFDEVLEQEQTGRPARQAPGGGCAREDETVEFHTRIHRDETPSGAIIRGITAIEGVDPLDLDVTLYDSVDPEALDSMLAREGSETTADIRIEFPFGGYWISATTTDVMIEEKPRRT